MFIRFVISKNDEDSGRRQGIFQTLVDARDDDLLLEHEVDRVKEIHNWFNEHLKKPASFNKSARHNTLNKAISWYKDTANEHISYMRELAYILENHGIFVETIYTDRPGYIVYEDEHQITAEPFDDTGA